MTELEFEKACRGTNAPMANEYAWGDTTISATTSLSNDGTSTEAANAGNCNYNNCSPDGPYRAGIYATGSSTRQSSGASYWGIMDLSGTLWKRPVTVGNSTGRGFTGTNGDGQLSATGDANVTGWPGTDCVGAGLRGGNYDALDVDQKVSKRQLAAYTFTGRYRYTGGGRAVRGASGIDP